MLQLERSLHAILHSLELTGDVTTNFILDIIQSVQAEYTESFLYRQFTKEEQSILKAQLPDLTTHNEKTTKWMNLVKKDHQLKNEPIESDISQQLAKEIMQFIHQDLQIEYSLIDKYWEKIKPDNEQSEKVLGLDKETMEYIEDILDWYELYGEGTEDDHEET